MILSRKIFLTTIVAMSSAAMLPALAWAQAKIAEVAYPNEITLAGQKLQLNGYGIRFRFGFRVYAAALYSPTKLTKNEDVIKPTLIKRLHLVALRDVKADDFGRLFTRGMEENMTKEDFSKIVNGVIRMGNYFAEARQLSKGDSMTIDVVPGTGVILALRGKQQGEPIKEPEFSQAMMQIWFGRKPADEALRKALLGEQSTANTNIS